MLNDDSRTMVIRTRDPHRGDQGVVRSHRRAARGWTDTRRRVSAGRSDRPDSGLRGADSVGRARSLPSTTSACCRSRTRSAGGSTASSRSDPTCCSVWYRADRRVQRADLIQDVEFVADAPMLAEAAVAGAEEVRGLHRERLAGRLDALRRHVVDTVRGGADRHRCRRQTRCRRPRSGPAARW